MAVVKHRIPERSLRRLFIPALCVLLVVLVGAGGYRFLGGGRWPFDECLYMTVITVSTVGFAEVLDGLGHVAGGRAWTMGLILVGSGAMLYFLSTLTAMIIETDLGDVLKRRRMQKKIDALSAHVIVCGAGTTGIHVIEELARSATPFVVIDIDAKRLSYLSESKFPGLLYVEGDAAEDEVLERAGIARAHGVVAALSDDHSNLYVTVSSRALNPELRIVAKAVEHSAGPKLLRAGANATVSPNEIGALRLVGEMVRPRVVRFLDATLNERDDSLRIEEFPVEVNSQLAGTKLADTAFFGRTDLAVIAIQSPDGSFHLNPRPEARLEPGSALIVLGHVRELARLVQSLATR